MALLWTLAAFLIGAVAAEEAVTALAAPRTAAAAAAAHNATFHVTRNSRGDIFTKAATGMEQAWIDQQRKQGRHRQCSEESCVGASSGTATLLSTTADHIENTNTNTCWCQCHPHLPAFREDLNICVDDILDFKRYRRKYAMSSGKKLPQYLAAISISIGALGTGSALAWTSNIIEDLKAGKLNDLKMDDDQLGWAGSCMTLGAMIICIPMGFVCEWIGRKGAALAAAIPLLLGWIMVMFANHVGIVYAGRVLTGIGGGAFCVVGPLYTSEICEPAIRGILGSFFQFFLCIGILYVNVFGYAMSTLLLFNISCAVVPVVFAACFIFHPESPVYYMRRGKQDKAQKSLERLRGKNYDGSGELKTIQTSIEQEKQMAKFKAAIKTKAAKKATLICFMLMMYQQFCGINAVTFYTQEIFKAAGSQLPPHWCVIILGVVQVVVLFFATLLIERAGRKILLMASCALMTVGSAMIGLVFTFKDRKIMDEDGVKSIGFVPIIGVNLFCMGFALGLGPIAWLASAEIFPPEVKSKCSAAAATFNWFLAFIVSRFYLNLANAIGNDITFFIFAGVAASGIFFTFFVIPETKGKTFEQIVAELEGRQS